MHPTHTTRVSYNNDNNKNELTKNPNWLVLFSFPCASRTLILIGAIESVLHLRATDKPPTNIKGENDFDLCTSIRIRILLIYLYISNLNTNNANFILIYCSQWNYLIIIVIAVWIDWCGLFCLFVWCDFIPRRNPKESSKCTIVYKHQTFYAYIHTHAQRVLTVFFSHRIFMQSTCNSWNHHFIPFIFFVGVWSFHELNAIKAGKGDAMPSDLICSLVHVHTNKIKCFKNEPNTNSCEIILLMVRPPWEHYLGFCCIGYGDSDTVKAQFVRNCEQTNCTCKNVIDIS